MREEQRDGRFPPFKGEGLLLRSPALAELHEIFLPQREARLSWCWETLPV